MLHDEQWFGSREQIGDIARRLEAASSTSAAKWTLQVQNEDGQHPDWDSYKDWVGIHIVRELPFLDAIYQWGGMWNEKPEQYFKAGLTHMDAALSDSDLRLLRKLHDGAKEREQEC